MAFPFVKQHDLMQCGVACLKMICQFYHCYITLDKLDNLCNPTSEGVSLRGISEAAQEIGFNTTALKIKPDLLTQLPLPAILHWNQNHFVVLYKIGNNGKSYYISDPAKGKVKYNRDEFLRHWAPSQPADSAEGIIMLLEPSENLKTEEKHRVNVRQTFAILFSYIKKYRAYFFQIALGLLLGCLFQLLFPILTQSIVDIGIKNSDINFIWLILLGELLIVLGSATSDFIRRWLLLHISMRINVFMISDFFIKLMKLPMSFFDTKLFGDLLQRMTDHSRVQNFLTNNTLNVSYSILSFTVFGIVLFVYDKLIFIVFIGATIIYTLWTTLFLRRRRILDYELFEQQAINNNKTYQLITSMQEIKLNGCEDNRRWEWEDVQAELFLIQMKSLKLQQTQEGGGVFINEIKNILVTVLAATAVIHGEITLGGMLAIQYIIGQLNSPADQLIGFISTIQDVKISLDRINEISSKEDEENGRKGFADSLISSIRFENVTFKYDKHSSVKALDDVSLNIQAGKMTAIVGASGSGKTTILKLLLGFYPIDNGDVFIGNESVGSISLADWRSRCGCVMQEGKLFSDTILRNISPSEPQPDIDRVKEAAKIAKIDGFIDTLPLGYKTKIGKDGVGLSKGQTQRILIARALYRNPEYILLDEATNALDAENEHDIIRNLEMLREGRTLIIVAHRLSTVKTADNIIVLENGKIVEEGRHDELVKRRGRYFNLIQNQLELGS